ncbi:uncharacterized protein LOC114516798 [Dendronephthya gigantea]|uniref:uncharacterized protein LOC114516798 n=1 Tax=Dendronephthya gigantea TaxID=151771 RepID=UPI0010695974|nr:uncharacterized protein LOC114516798 [Dendronephthya gigantea]
MAPIPKGYDFVQSIPFCLKIGASVALLISLSTLGFFLNNGDITLPSGEKTFDLWGKKQILNVAILVIALALLSVILLIFLFVSGFHEQMDCVNWPSTVAINMIFWSLLLFIFGCLIADTSRKYDDVKQKHGSLCDVLRYNMSDARCDHLIASSVTCFTAFITLSVDAYLNFQNYWAGRQRQPTLRPVRRR